MSLFLNLVNVSTFPNPTSDFLNVNSKEVIEKAEIFNILGKKIRSINVGGVKAKINVSDLNAGIYLIKYTINNAVGSMKFIKE